MTEAVEGQGERRDLSNPGDELLQISYMQALGHCESLDSYRCSRSGERSISEDEVATQILVPLMEHLAKCRDSSSADYLAHSAREAAGQQSDKMDCSGGASRESKGMSGRQSSDVWAAARIAYELLVGDASFQIADNIPQDSLPGFLNFLSVDCADFLQFAFKKEESERPTAHQCLSHPWLQYHMSKQCAARGKESGERHIQEDSDISQTIEEPLQCIQASMSSWRIKARESGSWSSDASSSSDFDMSPFTPQCSFDASFQDEAEDIQPRCVVAEGKPKFRRQAPSRLRSTAAVNNPM